MVPSLASQPASQHNNRINSRKHSGPGDIGSSYVTSASFPRAPWSRPPPHFYPAGRLRRETLTVSGQWKRPRMGPIIYGAFTRVCARARVGGCPSYTWPRVFVVPSCQRRNRREGWDRCRGRGVRDSCLTRFREKASNRNRALWASVFATPLSSRKSECTRADTADSEWPHLQ